jgi:hypothetical protein
LCPAHKDVTRSELPLTFLEIDWEVSSGGVGGRALCLCTQRCDARYAPTGCGTYLALSKASC